MEADRVSCGLAALSRCTTVIWSSPSQRPRFGAQHFGPYSFLETITSPGAGFDNHAIRGTVADLGRLSALVEAKLATMSPGDKIRIHEEFAPDSPYALLLDLREDGYDPPTADSLLAGENSSGSLPDYNWDEVSKAIEHGDYDFVLKNAMPHALAGNSDAQCTIAFLYEAGWGVQRDVLEAERWLLKATAQNSPLAWHNLGTLYFVQHRELEHKWCEGRKCWERAKELGFNCGEPYPPWDPRVQVLINAFIGTGDGTTDVGLSGAVRSTQQCKQCSQCDPEAHAGTQKL